MYVETMAIAAKSLLVQALVPSWFVSSGLLLIDDQITQGLIKEHLHISQAFQTFYLITGGLAVLITLASRALKLRREYKQQQRDFKDLE